MKILLCHNHYRLRSGEDIAFDLCRELLQRDGHTLLTYEKDSRAIDNLSPIGKLKTAGGVIYRPSSRRAVRELARRERPDVALVQNVFPLISPAVYYGLADAGVPVVQLIFNYRILCLNGQFFTAGKICERCATGNYLHGVIRRCLHQSYFTSGAYAASLGVHRLAETWNKLIKLFIVPDTFLKGKLGTAGLPAERMRVVCNPFSLEGYQPEYSSGRFALFVGRLIRPKGIFTLLDASMEVAELPVVIVGDGEDADEVRRHPAVVSGRVTILPATYGDKLRELLRQAAMVIVPSEWYDNLPMIVCQAFACGKPVVASRINGIPEYVKDEVNGLLFSPKDAGGLARCIQRLARDGELRERLGRAGRQTAETEFSSSVWLRRTRAVLEEAVT